MEISKKDFVSSLPLLDHKNQKIIFEDEKYIFLSRINLENPNEPEITFFLFSKNKIFKKSFTYNSFKDYKAAMGFEGSWKNLFQTFSNAIEGVDDGTIQIKLPVSKTEKLTLIIVHPIAKEIKVSGNIEMDKVNADSLKEVYFDGLIELFDSKESIKTKIIEEKDNEKKVNLVDNNNLINNKKENNKSFSNGLEFKQNVKRKFHSNLINPNIKKRKKKGVQFIEDDNENKDEKEEDENE